MYHASRALVPNDAQSSGGFKTVAFVSVGAHKFLLKLCTPPNNGYADKCGSMHDVLGILKES